jgi:hypothetical protein
MFDVFRFVALRPPEQADVATAIALRSDTALLSQMRRALAGPSPRKALRELADAYIDGDRFLPGAAKVAEGASLGRLHERVQALSSVDETSLAAWTGLVRDATGRDAGDSLGVLVDVELRLHESLAAVKLGAWRPGFESLELARDIRLLALLRRIDAGDVRLQRPGAGHEALQRAIVLPREFVDLPRSLPPAPGATDSGGASSTDDRGALLRRYALLEQTHRRLQQTEPDEVSWQVRRLAPVIDGEPERPSDTARALRASAGALLRSEVEQLGQRDAELDVRLDRWRKLEGFAAAEDIASLDGESTPAASSASLDVAKLLLKREAAASFAPDAVAALKELKVDLGTTSLPVALQRVADELGRLTPAVMAGRRSVAETLSQQRVVAIGSQLVPSVALPDMLAATQPMAATPGPTPVLPTTFGNLKPAGIGDLLVTRQQLVGYEAGEVAHIENVLKGESQKREVSRSETVEETTLTEQESTKEESRDLQSTDRFELQKESQNVLALDGRVAPGGFRGPSFGPVVEFENGDQTQLHGVQTLTEKNASKFSQDVTSRAANRVTERSRTQLTRRMLREFRETTSHAFDNKDSDNVVGVYQWIDKLYRAQVYHYGKRLFYDLVVPEPAAFLVQAYGQFDAEGRGLVKPEPLVFVQADGTTRPLQPDDLGETNIGFYAARYGATGLRAPPDAYMVVSKIFVGSTPPTPAQMELAVPPEYEPATTVSSLLLAGPAASLHLKTSLDLEVSKGGYWYAQLGCRRKASTWRQWQLSSFDTLVRAYAALQQRYDERLASVQAALRIGALGQTPQQKRALERIELKKACITLFTQQHFDLFGAIDSPKDRPVLYPQIDLARAEPHGKYIRFFEQAFEWEQMLYRFYPYFWGRKAHWVGKVMTDEPDPQFAEFLQAGAARSLVPVRPGFENAVIHFMETGEVWGGGEPPPVTGPLYLALLGELRAAQPAADGGVPYGEPWTIRLPTSLVRLRADGKLPRWHEVNGQWVEQPPA